MSKDFFPIQKLKVNGERWIVSGQIKTVVVMLVNTPLIK